MTCRPPHHTADRGTEEKRWYSETSDERSHILYNQEKPYLGLKNGGGIGAWGMGAVKYCSHEDQGGKLDFDHHFAFSSIFRKK